MWFFNNRKRKKSVEYKLFLRNIRSYENKAFEYLALDQTEKAITILSDILKLPPPPCLTPDELESSELRHKISRIRFKIDSLKLK